MVYDSARGVTVLFGGFRGSHAYEGDTWLWDGTTWTLWSTTGPSRRSDHAMAYDDARGVTVLFGGYGGSYRGDTWELVTFCDEDGDGVDDSNDACGNSDLGATVVLDGCDSGVSNHLFADGCTMADRVAQCESDAEDYGGFVACVVHLTREWGQAGLIDRGDRWTIRGCAVQGNISPSEGRKGVRTGTGRVLAEALEMLSHP